MASESSREKSAVSKLRDRFFQKKTAMKPSEELKNALKKKQPRNDEQAGEDRKKIATPPKPRGDLDL